MMLNKIKFTPADGSKNNNNLFAISHRRCYSLCVLFLCAVSNRHFWDSDSSAHTAAVGEESAPPAVKANSVQRPRAPLQHEATWHTNCFIVPD